MNVKWYGLVVSLALGLGMAGCTTLRPHSVAFTNNYREIADSVTAPSVERGEVCSHRLFYLFQWGDSSVHAAMNRFRQKVEDGELTHVTVDVKSSNYWIYSRDCTIVRGYFVAAPISRSTSASSGTSATRSPRIPTEECGNGCIGFVTGAEKLGVAAEARAELIRRCLTTCRDDPAFRECLGGEGGDSFDRCAKHLP